jgi:hypothetical protein
LTYRDQDLPPKGRRLGAAVGLATAAALIAFPGSALAGSGGVGPSSGGTTTTSAPAGQATPGARAKLQNGFAVPPADAPPKVVRAIEAANRIVKGKPYCMGGGHARWNDSCYDCSGSISYALGDKGAGIIDAPMPSGSFMRWERRGPGRWITVYANAGHMYAVIAGLRLDTSNTVGDGPGWSTTGFRRPGFAVRHPRGL